MDKTIQQLPGYQVHEYKITLLPHEELRKHITDVRMAFNEKFQIESPTTGDSQVTLAIFKQIQAVEERIINHLKVIAMAEPAFKVELKDYGCFPTHTIFINVTSKVPIRELVKKIRHSTQKLMKLDDENKPHFMMDSHINLATKLKPWQFEKSWLEYGKRHFTGRFIADRMLLLRRRVGAYKYQVVGSFKFENMPIDIKQGELF